MSDEITVETEIEDEHAPHLLRRFGFWQATALNMANMVGVGPFITIPVLMSALAGPQAMLGWLVAIAVVIPDGMIWSELGAMMPGSGGSYLYLRDGFGRQTFGRLMAFLFIWQFILSGPLEIASGYIGFAHYAHFLWANMSTTQGNLIAVAVGLVTIALLYRRITSIGALTIALWIGTLLTMAVVIVAGITHFSPATAFDFPPHAFGFNIGFLLGLGAAARIGVYDYLGYYDVCYIGDEVRDPGRVIPRSILVSVLVIAVLYLGINLSVIGVVPWRQFVPADNNPTADYVVAIFMQRLYGSGVAKVFVLMVLWTAFASCFALLLGYSRIPYAAAKDGYFFRVFARLHPTKNFPFVSLLVIGGISIACSFFPLDAVINAMLATRILVQFIGQIAAVALLRKRAPDRARPYRIWGYPVTALIALVGWAFLFVTLANKQDWPVMLFGLAIPAAGAVVFLVSARITRTWPFARAVETVA